MQSDTNQKDVNNQKSPNLDAKMNAKELRASWGLGLIISIRMFGMFMVLPVITAYGMLLQDASEFLIGVAIGIYGLMQALLQIPLGIYSDKIGRKPIIIDGLFILLLGSILAALSESIWGIILGRALQGCGAISAAAMALLSDLTREQNRTKAMVIIGVSFGLTFAISLVAGPIITNLVGFNGLFWFISCLSSLAILLTVFCLPKQEKIVINTKANSSYQYFATVISDVELLKLNASIFCLHILLMGSFIAIPIQMLNAGLNAAEHWKFYLASLLLSFIVVLPLIIYSETKHKIKAVFCSCIALLFSAEIIFFFSDTTLSVIFFGLLIFFIAFNLLEALLPSMISKITSDNTKGTAMGFYSTSQFLGVAIGGFVGGWIVEQFSVGYFYIFALLLCLTWLYIALKLKEIPAILSLYLPIPIAINDKNSVQIQQYFENISGVKNVIVNVNEKNIYLKIDKKITNRQNIELALDDFLNSANKTTE